MPLESDYKTLRALFAQGSRLCARKEWDSARALFDDVRCAARELADAETEAWAEEYLGRIDRDTGVLNGAMEHFGRALQLAEALKQTGLKATTLDSMAGVYVRRGEYDTAFQYYQLALNTDPVAASHTNGNLARLNLLIGNATEAKRLLEEANRGYRNRGMGPAPALMHIDRAQVALMSNDLTAALAEARAAHQEGSRAGDKRLLEAAMVIVHRISSAFADERTPFLQIRAALATQFGEAEKEMEITLRKNACVAMGKRSMPVEAAQLCWALFTSAAERDLPGVRDFLRPRLLFNRCPSQKVEIQLQKMLLDGRDSQSPEDIATIRVALAHCLGSQGKFEPAIRQAQMAKESLSKALFEGSSAGCEVLLRELLHYQQATRT